jgi:PBP1b-binding outer membrane lipoprotein LpoB
MIKYLLFFNLLFFHTACNKEAKPSSYQDSKVTYLNSIRWGEEELQELSHKMVQSILGSKNINKSGKKSYIFDEIRNDTHDQIDTKMLQNKIISSLRETTKFKFIEKNKTKESYLFKGKLSSIFKKNKHSKDMFFNFTLMLIDSKSSEVIWSNEIEIRKIYKQPLFGW